MCPLFQYLCGILSVITFTCSILNTLDRTDLTDAGTLKGFDQTVNLVLDDAHERVFSDSQGVEQVPLGLYLIRGDNV